MQLIPADWYPDPFPSDSNMFRYWDGNVWTGWVSIPGGQPTNVEIPWQPNPPIKENVRIFAELPSQLTAEQIETRKAENRAKTGKVVLGAISFLDGMQEAKARQESKEIRRATLGRARYQNAKYKNPRF